MMTEMADFWTADKRIASAEGFYSNHPADTGGETLWGIARNKNPHWRGWVIVDDYKKKPGFPGNLRNDQNLYRLRGEFYKSEYWDKINGDRIQSQIIAEEKYDTAVNMGVGMAIRFSERTAGMAETGRMSEDLLNYLNSLT